jgi:hypothetical protein
MAMKEERSDKLIREKIDELALSEKNMGFDKQLSWQKLETMLPPQHNNKAWIYYAAAAIVLIMCAALYMNKQDRKDNIVVNKVEALKHAEITTQDFAVKDFTRSRHEKRNIIKSAAKFRKPLDNNPVLLPAAVVKEVPQNDNINENPKIVTTLNTNPSALNGQEPIVKVLTPKQKFRIIHINEMEDRPVSTGIAKQSPAIKIKLSFLKPALPIFINPDEIPPYDATREIKRGGLFEASLSN